MRYIGSKKLLLTEIENIVDSYALDSESFCDIFSGTAVVARNFKKRFEIISNDLLHLSFVLQKATIENDDYPLFAKVKDVIGKDPFDYFNEKKSNLKI